MSTGSLTLGRTRGTDVLGERRETIVGHIVGLMLFAGGCGMTVCAVVEKLGGGTSAVSLAGPGLGFGIGGALLWRGTSPPRRAGPSTIFGGILAGWIAFSLAAAVPYVLSGTVARYDLALFEAVSGFTTTASSVIHPIDGVARGILMWRAMTQWLGGVAITVFVVSVLPYFRSAGFEHLAGIAGGWGGERLASRVRETSKRIVAVYVVFTAVIAALYAAFGMSAFDAVAHAFTTASTGGFSTHDASLDYYHSAAIEWVAIVAMVLAGVNFALYWQAVRGKPLSLLRSVEVRAYLLVVGVVAVAAVGWQARSGGASIRRTLFGAVSISTTTGYTLVDYNRWAGAVQLLLLFAMAIGGMAGSAAGGFKPFRLLGMVGHVRRHLFRQLHPRAVHVVRIGDEVISDAVITGIVGFFGLFMALGAGATFLVAALGSLDMKAAVSVVVTSLGNVGPSLGAPPYLALRAGARGVLMVVMLAGRLEIYPVLLGVVPLARFVADRLPRRVAQALVRAGRG